MHHDVVVYFYIGDLWVVVTTTTIYVNGFIAQVVDIVSINAAIAYTFLEVDAFISAFHIWIAQANLIVTNGDINGAIGNSDDLVFATMGAKFKQVVFNDDITDIVVVAGIFFPFNTPYGDPRGTGVIRMVTRQGDVFRRWCTRIFRTFESKAMAWRFKYFQIFYNDMAIPYAAECSPFNDSFTFIAWVSGNDNLLAWST